MNSEMLFNLTPAMNMWIAQITCVVLALIACRGDQSEEKHLVIFFSIIPVIGYIIGAVSAVMIVQRTMQSKGKCILGHNLTQTYDSEAEKWKNGRRPMRISMGGYTKYQCTCCKVEQSYSWKAF